MADSRPLSYQSLKCVFRHLEVHNRVYLTGRMPKLGTVNKVVPKKIDYLGLDNPEITINDWIHRFLPVVGQDCGPGEEVYMVTSYDVRNPTTGAQSPQKVLTINSDRAIPILLSNYLAGSSVHINNLIIVTFYKIAFPSQMRLYVQNLSLHYDGSSTLNEIGKLLAAPLNSLSIKPVGPNDPIFENVLLTTAENLIIDFSGQGVQSWIQILKNLQNKSIHFSDKITLIDLMELARRWIAERKEVGTKFSMQADTVPQFLFSLQMQLKAKKVDIPSRRCPTFSFSLTLPINETSELNIFGMKKPSEFNGLIGGMWPAPDMLVVEVMAIGSAVPF